MTKIQLFITLVKKKLLYYFSLFILVFTIGVQAVYLLYFFLIKKDKQNIQKSTFKQGISVIICAHKEAENLQKHLPLFLKQDYKDFEIIIVDDRSNDNTTDILKTFKDQIKIITIAETKENWNPKKWALQVGVANASFEHLLFTDADCYPNSEQWITCMAQGFLESDLVIGFGAYEKRKGILNALIQYETFQTAVAMLGLAQKGINFMAVGRNFACTKTIYQNFDWGNLKNKTGGDDDLLINYQTQKATTIVKKEAHTLSIPKENYREYLVQKTRHISIGNYYNLKNKVLIGIYNLSLFGFYILPLLLFAKNTDYYVLIGAIIVRTLILFYTFTIVTTLLRIKLSTLEILYLDFFYVFTLWLAGNLALVSKKIKWK